MVATKLHIRDILKAAVQQDASDIHIKVGSPPLFRVHREIKVEDCFPVITVDDSREFLTEITNTGQRQLFQDTCELDISYTDQFVGRFRVNIYMQRGTIAMVFRWVRKDIPTLEELGLPQVCQDLAAKRDGLVILTGPTGCGKSTTLAAMLNYMNQNMRRNIVTVEDPIEFLHVDNMCTFSQREVGVDTSSFASGLKHVFRQDPDVIFIGEMRDLETMSIALTAAETGHLILTTLHTPSSYEAIDRFVDAFPAEQHPQVRVQLSTTLQAVLYQQLVPRADKEGLIPAVEALIATPAIRNLIREGKSYQMLNFMQSDHGLGMCSLEQALIDLYSAGRISQQEARARLRSLDILDETAKKSGSPKRTGNIKLQHR